MNVILGMIARNWRSQGGVYFGPGEQEAIDAFCLARVQSMGKLVVDPSATVLPAGEVPENLTVWRPQRTTALPRRILGVDDGWIYYADVWVSDDEQGILPRVATDRCRPATWHRWVRRTRAVRG